MDDNSKGPYKHYERPNKPRSTKISPDKKSWKVWLGLIVVVLIALVPTVYYLSAQQRTAKVYTLEKTSKSDSAKRKSSKLSSKKGSVESSKKSTALKKSATKAASTTKKNSISANNADTYVVKSGDTLSGIATENGMTVDQLAELNGITDTSQLYAGQVLKLK